MKISILKKALVFAFMLFLAVLKAQETKPEFYQLKTYTFNNEEQEQTTDHYLEKAFLPALKRQGINTVGVFKLRAAYNSTANKTYVLIPFSDLSSFQNLEAKLEQDAAYAADGKVYLGASHEKPPYQRISSVLMKAFKDMPQMKSPKFEGETKDRVYELRSYEGPTENYYKRKVHMFNEGGEIPLFESLGFNAVFFAEVLAGEQMPNLMYMTTFENMDSREAHWKAFFSSEKWDEIKDLPQYKNTVSQADIILLYPTEYSDY
ncbi:MAG: NIPSNAP family protein [Flavobacteriaceae bacterium]